MENVRRSIVIIMEMMIVSAEQRWVSGDTSHNYSARSFSNLFLFLGAHNVLESMPMDEWYVPILWVKKSFCVSRVSRIIYFTMFSHSDSININTSSRVNTTKTRKMI